MKAVRVLGVVSVLALAVGCATPDQRTFYREAIKQFSPKLPRSDMRCWLTPDLVGPSAGSQAIAEEVFTEFLLASNLCRVVEKHPDATAGYTWPASDVCPCASGVQSCSAYCPATDAGAALPSLGGGSAVSGHDNNRSGDKLLERHKKATLPNKLVIYRIDELTANKAVIHFRVADARTTTIEQAQTVTVEVQREPVHRD